MGVYSAIHFVPEDHGWIPSLAELSRLLAFLSGDVKSPPMIACVELYRDGYHWNDRAVDPSALPGHLLMPTTRPRLDGEFTEASTRASG
jgi:hypothetical protein